MDNNKKMKDFLSSIVIFFVALFVIAESHNIYVKAGKVFYLSPALIPMMLGVMLLLLSLVLLGSSLKDGGIAARNAEIKEFLKAVKEDPNSVRMLVGVVLMALYTFVLMEFLPFWLATFLFMLILMYFLEAGSLVKIIGISVVITALVIFLFQICFRVPLP